MKIRNGFVSNSSSSSFIVYGFGNSDVLQELYDTVTSILDQDSSLDDLTYDEMAEVVTSYLDSKGVNYCHYDYDNSYIECIGCELREGTEKEFMESLEKAKKTLKAFDEEHGTNFADKAVIISDVIVDY